ncbi:tRNA (adenosine(37)-N6)-threonylcarbamoyltransferase complex transferase subunit TsaD [Leptotrichia sp. OH3620_COT-345]|uniref:tRNA (adenosine(37)-N6)-threonylcarbamoyltransferase complex transferase subunit TsaD n=1 Tax=Leptotrichia sp. OH3620_COT-345 TaxID=2491048 RepID=UPI000F65200E|nr:tRNA (adenosine(37)-N6)-threonylcarbamoyltransferase complex transferase subunit TsaD [Leptotrichia sp. OH3620_COT-345]RRD39165.1 tRNA (adenosine(37)-N6)-threonylcarbamoyltransferase complex transferase subunit TsaD [Leptotrichia sp. OH3620_COT-345]
MKILAFETSCDETSVAVVENGKNVLSNIISSQIDIHKEYGGVVPEIASRHHIENILPVFEEAMEKAECRLKDIDYIAVTNTPGLIGSLLVGLMFAKSLSYANEIPLIPINHIEGHIFSNFIENDVNLPAVSLIVSGGHTDLYYINNENGKIKIELMGETLDDAVGEVYDKIARILNLPYPGGPEIERLSVGGEKILKIKKPNIEGYNFSFSGIKTYITNYINNESMKGNKISKENVAKSFQEIIVQILYDKVLKAVNEKKVNTVLVAGGVSANKRLREKFKELPENIKINFPKMEYCTDNGAMIGAAAYYKLKNKEYDIKENKYNLDAKSTKEKHKDNPKM